jgi:hypothetical protein
MATVSHSRVPFNNETRRWGGPIQIGVFAKNAASFVAVEHERCEEFVRLIKIGVHPALVDFAKGKEGDCPNAETRTRASRLVEIATHRTENPDIHVDFEGALSFDLRLPNGQWLFAELFINGNLDVSVYDDDSDKWTVNWPCATESQFVGLF